MNTTDRAGAFLIGASTLVGGLLLGKSVVDLIQGDSPSRPGEGSPFVESVRLVGSLVGISVSVMQLPAAWVAAQKFIKTGDLPAP